MRNNWEVPQKERGKTLSEMCGGTTNCEADAIIGFGVTATSRKKTE